MCRNSHIESDVGRSVNPETENRKPMTLGTPRSAWKSTFGLWLMLVSIPSALVVLGASKGGEIFDRVGAGDPSPQRQQARATLGLSAVGEAKPETSEAAAWLLKSGSRSAGCVLMAGVAEEAGHSALAHAWLVLDGYGRGDSVLVRFRQDDARSAAADGRVPGSVRMEEILTHYDPWRRWAIDWWNFWAVLETEGEALEQSLERALRGP